MSGKVKASGAGAVRSGGTVLYKDIARRIKSEIDSGKMPPGSRLPSLDSLSKVFGVNRLTVRKAVLMLRDAGMLRSVPAQGTFVCAPPFAGVSGHVRARAGRRSTTVGLLSRVLVPFDFGPYHQEVLSGINEALSAGNANLLIFAAACRRTEDLPKIVEEADVDAMIFMGPFENDLLRALTGGRRPSVAVDYTFRGIPCDSVSIDNELGGAILGELLSDAGLSGDFGIVAGNGDSADRGRAAGLARAFEEAGRKFSPVFTVSGRYTRAGGAAAVRAMLDSGAAMPSAIVCMNDEMALGVMDALKEFQVDVPGRVRVSGFDNIGLSAAMRPGLTTVDACMRQAGSIGAGRLLRRLGGCSEAVVSTVISPFLVRRETM